MKKAGFTFFLAFSLLQVFSQMKVALVGGPHSASIKGFAADNAPGAPATSYTSRFGLHFGVVADIPFSFESRFSFQPGVVFTNKGIKTSIVYDTLTSDKYNTQITNKINYIDIPLNLVFKKPLGPKAKFIIGAGPYLSFFYNGSVKSETFYINGTYQADENKDLPVGGDEDQYRTMDYGINALTGFEFNKVFLTLNFSRGLGNFFTESGTSAKLNHQTVGGTLGIFLGQPVKMAPRDKDKDGIPDTEDLCPEEPGTAATQGCPDQDGDGIADKSDHCPDVPGLAKYNGCPIPDSDKDGINDELDKCPDVPGLAKYQGCPIPDSDGDGINDEEDHCPNEAGLARYQGCPIPDRDSDGVNDEIDKCPDVAGLAENNGCPEIRQEIVKQVDSAAKKIQFQLNKAILLTDSYQTLDHIISVLKENPELKVIIEGHSSREGNPDYNLKLSRERAESVKAYFEENGIEPARLQAIGYGSARPINEGKTEAERVLNRRVEIRLSNQ